MKKEWVFEDIQVECYSGYKGEESPRAFVYQGRRYGDLEILDRWYEGGLDPQAIRHDYFKVQTPEGEVFLLRHTPRFEAWTLCRQVPVPDASEH